MNKSDFLKQLEQRKNVLISLINQMVTFFLAIGFLQLTVTKIKEQITDNKA